MFVLHISRIYPRLQYTVVSDYTHHMKVKHKKKIETISNGLLKFFNKFQQFSEHTV